MSNADNARRFAIDLEKFASEDIPNAVATFHQAVTLDLLKRLVDKSPVGNPNLWKLTAYGLLKKSLIRKRTRGYVGGTFRGFWQVYTSDPGNGQTPPPKGTRPRSAGAAITAGTRAARGIAPFTVSYIVNGMPYAERLNAGWSTQAPAGFVELAVAEVQNSLRAEIAP